ncbi:MAG: alpha/beta fold hydrolase [Acidobacteriaceae bacterium]
MSNEIRSLFLSGTAGRLEALLNAGDVDAKYAAVVSHPHPMFGGTMHNKVVYHTMKALSGFGFPVLRFNFRGAGLSEGAHDQGQGEIDDVRTALAFMHDEFKVPLLFAGFSFGAATGLRAACPDPRVKAMISLGTPVAVQGRVYTYHFLESCAKPKLFISGTRDEYGPIEKLEQVVARSAPPKELVLVEGADHFFAGKLDIMQKALEDWVMPLL